MGLNDPRTYGSKNPGATNVLRSGSKAAAVVTLLLDAVKGWLPVAAIQWWGQPYGLGEGTMALAGFAAFIGHLYPVFFRFVGGKGVATALGVLVATSGWLALATGLTWLIVAYCFPLLVFGVFGGSIVCACVLRLWRWRGVGNGPQPDLLSTAVMSIFLIWRHSENISRLVKGTESKLGKKKEAAR